MLFEMYYLKIFCCEEIIRDGTQESQNCPVFPADPDGSGIVGLIVPRSPFAHLRRCHYRSCRGLIVPKLPFADLASWIMEMMILCKAKKLLMDYILQNL